MLLSTRALNLLGLCFAQAKQPLTPGKSFPLADHICIAMIYYIRTQRTRSAVLLIHAIATNACCALHSVGERLLLLHEAVAEIPACRRRSVGCLLSLLSAHAVWMRTLQRSVLVERAIQLIDPAKRPAVAAAQQAARKAAGPTSDGEAFRALMQSAAKDKEEDGDKVKL